MARKTAVLGVGKDQLLDAFNNQRHVSIVEPEKQHRAQDKTGKETGDENHRAHRLGDNAEREKTKYPGSQRPDADDHRAFEHGHGDSRTTILALNLPQRPKP